MVSGWFLLSNALSWRLLGMPHPLYKAYSKKWRRRYYPRMSACWTGGQLHRRYMCTLTARMPAYTRALSSSLSRDKRPFVLPVYAYRLPSLDIWTCIRSLSKRLAQQLVFLSFSDGLIKLIFRHNPRLFGHNPHFLGHIDQCCQLLLVRIFRYISIWFTYIGIAKVCSERLKDCKWWLTKV